MNTKGDDRRASLKEAQKALSEVMRRKEAAAAGRKRKQAAMDELLTPSKKSVESTLIGTQKSGSKELDAKIVSIYSPDK